MQLTPHTDVATLPTDTLPGSAERIRAYAARASQQKPLYVAGDAAEDPRGGNVLRRYRNGYTWVDDAAGRSALRLPEKLPARIAVLRRRGGYTQRTFAAAIGKTRRIVQWWESGRYSPTLRSLRSIATLLKVPLVDLIGDASQR